MGLQESDDMAAAVAVAERVALSDIETAIVHEAYTDGLKISPDGPQSLKLLTICVIVHRNGFICIGKSAPASPKNFNAELGRKFAREDALRQLWPLMGFALKEKLHLVKNPTAGHREYE